MTGTAAKPTEEALHQVRRVQDVVTYLKKDDCSVRTNGNSQTRRDQFCSVQGQEGTHEVDGTSAGSLM